MINLRKARDNGTLDQFAADHQADAPGNEEAFHR